MKGMVKTVNAYLVLEDGSFYAGSPRGDFRETVCEFIFNTSMSGYVELLSDPAYSGKGVVMTYPLIGNYGVCREDLESDRLHPSALVVHELCDEPSNFRCEATLDEILKEYSVPCLTGVDTRKIAQTIGAKGAMKGLITDDISDMERCMKLIAGCEETNPAAEVSAKEIKTYGAENDGAKIAFVDFGTRRSIIDILTKRNCAVTVFPCTAKAEEILAGGFDAIFVSNGPGNPAAYEAEAKEIAKLFESGLPMLGIGLGHDIIALSQGGETEKMAHCHFGSNYPVKIKSIGRTFITAQEHSYAVKESAVPANAEISCVNVNDSTVEGLEYDGGRVSTFAFIPDANKGASATVFVYNNFIKKAEESK